MKSVVPGDTDHSIAVVFTTQSHHPGSFAVPSEGWICEEPGQEIFVLPWKVASFKDNLYVVGTQGSVIDEFIEQVTTATISYLGSSETPETT